MMLLALVAGMVVLEEVQSMALQEENLIQQVYISISVSLV